MNTCKTCKFWEQVKTDFDKKYHGENSGTCSCNKFIYDAEPIPEDGLSYWDYESYSAGFMTGGNFGCINHANR